MTKTIEDELAEREKERKKFESWTSLNDEDLLKTSAYDEFFSSAKNWEHYNSTLEHMGRFKSEGDKNSMAVVGNSLRQWSNIVKDQFSPSNEFRKDVGRKISKTESNKTGPMGLKKSLLKEEQKGIFRKKLLGNK